jgi:hypothetical protein
MVMRRRRAAIRSGRAYSYNTISAAEFSLVKQCQVFAVPCDSTIELQRLKDERLLECKLSAGESSSCTKGRGPRTPDFPHITVLVRLADASRDHDQRQDFK